MASSHPYEEPSLIGILVLAGFLLLLNGVNNVLKSLLYCGLIGQVFVGVLFGTPGSKLLGDAVESTISNLGYVGLILLVYEGGLSTSLSGLISSSLLSFLVALTGILLPIGLSFLLLPLGASSLQCFSAGASLSATSLGTAFTTLSSSSLLNTDVGTVLASAAMLDDVIGLVMLQVVTQLSSGEGTASDYGMVIGRALGASVGLVVVVVIICRLALRLLQYRPVASWIHFAKRSQLVKDSCEGLYFPLVAHTTLLLILVVAGSYAGTSVLLAAFIAGVTVRWWGDAVVPTKVGRRTTNDPLREPIPTLSSRPFRTGLQIYEQYYGPSTEHILKPFFFASIGFSIPISQMFRAGVVWKGVVYALLMFLAKAATGLWLVPGSLERTTRSQSTESAPVSRTEGNDFMSMPASRENTNDPFTEPTTNPHPDHSSDTPQVGGTLTSPDMPPIPPSAPHASPARSSSSLSTISPTPQPSNPLGDSSPHRSSSILLPPPTPRSSPSPVPGSPSPQSTSPETRALHAYAPALLGLAMVARGEIGFLIASVAQSHGIFDAALRSGAGPMRGGEEMYLVVVWAIVLCTIVGPVGVGALVKRIKRLEAQGGRG